MSSSKLLSGILLGAAAGAVLGILFAPDKGTETRRKIAEKGSDLTDSLKTKVNEYADVISEKYDTAKQKLTGMASEGKDLYNQAKDKVGSMGSDIRDTANS